MFWIILKLLLVLLLILANGFFVAAELAIVSVRRPRIEALAAAGKSNAQAVLRAIAHLDATISSSQFGITLASLALGWIGESTIEHLIEPTLMRYLPSRIALMAAHAAAATIAFSIITYFHIVLGEFVPKALALERTERVALAVARPMELFYATFRPFIRLINRSGIRILRWVGLEARLGHHSAYTEVELRQLITHSHQSGHLELDEQTLIHNVFEFTEMTVNRVMIPRTEVIAVEETAGFPEAVRKFELSGYSRLPVYRDNFDNVLGILHSKDVMRFMTRPHEFDLKKAIHPAVFIPDTARLGDVLRQMQRGHVHLAIVVDEHSGVEGILTLEDLLEEIVGEIQDEHDDRSPEPLARPSDEAFTIDGGLSVREANRQYHLNLAESDDYNTVAGFLIARAGRLLTPADSILHDRLRFTVERVARRRITHIKIERLGVEGPNPPHAPDAEDARDTLPLDVESIIKQPS